MRTLDYQTILNRVYEHFVVDEQPPGILDGEIAYHQIDIRGNDRPCAIGLFDVAETLDESIFEDLSCPSVRQLYHWSPHLLAEVFKVDGLTRGDMRSLLRVQESHDTLAEKHEHDSDLALFRGEMSAALEAIARDYGLKPLAL